MLKPTLPAHLFQTCSADRGRGIRGFVLGHVASARRGHVLLATEKIRALVDKITGNMNRIIEGEVVKKGDDDG
jgi:hypothetical protein